MNDSRRPSCSEDGALAAAIAERLAKAKSDLYAQMMLAGFTSERGWRISEQIRHHSREASPELEASVAIDHEGRLRES